MKCYETDRLILKTIEDSDFPILKKYLLKNKAFLTPWEPLRMATFYDDQEILKRLKSEMINNDNGSHLSLYISVKGNDNIIGNVTLSNIIKGPFQSCNIGYKLDESELNKGYITEAIKKVIEIAFNDLELHRIEANIMPRNISSIKVVEKLGFNYEGLGIEYLRINGVWEDHARYAIRNKSIK